MLGSSNVIVTLPWKTLSDGLSKYSTTSWCAVRPLSIKVCRFSRIVSRPCQSATPRLHTAFSAKQSNPLPNVFSSISFHMANSQSGGDIFVKVIVLMVRSCDLVGADAFCAPQNQSGPASSGGSANLPSFLAKLPLRASFGRGCGNINA